MCSRVQAWNVSSGLPCVAAQRRDLEQGDGAVGAGDDEASVLEADVGLGRFQRVGGERRSLGDDLVGGAPDRRAAHVGGARAAMAAAGRQSGRYRPGAAGCVRWARRGGAPRICGKVVSWPWPICCVPVISDTVPSVSNRDVDVLVRRAARALDVIGEAQAAQPARCLALPPPLGEAAASARAERMLEGLGEGAAVDLEAEGIGHRHRLGRHHVAAPQFGPVEAGPVAPRHRSAVPGCSRSRRSPARA